VSTVAPRRQRAWRRREEENERRARSEHFTILMVDGTRSHKMPAKEPFKVAAIKPTIPYDILDKIDIRIGTIELVEDVPKSDKLVRMTVDFGDHRRKILVGMKQEREDPREVEGKQALFVVNLEPRNVMGEMSEGMLFDIGYADGVIPVLATPESPVPNGTRAG
jgi:methionine--tRNA ligase beta chain